MNLFAWFRRPPATPAFEPELGHWPAQQKLSPQEADDLRASAAIRRSLAAAKYAEARALRTGEVRPDRSFRLIRKP